jgi:Phospholipase_D-nuclease N-terminal
MATSVEKIKESKMEYGGILGIIILALDIYAILKIVQSGASTGAKVLWILLVLLLPVVGLIIWFFAGPKGG